MGKKCNVPYCKGAQNLSSFAVPENSDEREKWSQILRCTLEKNHFVCEKHFHPESIRGDKVEMYDQSGKLIFTVSISFLNKIVPCSEKCHMRS